MVVFISGPMTGFENYNRRSFLDAEKALKSAGYVVLNPARLPDGLTREAYLEIDRAMLKNADAIYMLAGWETSEGAVEENMLALSWGLKVIDQCKDYVSPSSITDTSNYVFSVGDDKPADFETEIAETTYSTERVMTAADFLRIIRDEIHKGDDFDLIIYPEKVFESIFRFFINDEEEPF